MFGSSEQTQLATRCATVALALTKVMWGWMTWHEYTHNVFCQVGRVRALKAGGSLMVAWYLASGTFPSLLSKLRQDELLLPLILGERTWAVQLFHNRSLGPGFNPSRM